MLSLLLRNLFFTILQPGFVVVLVPYLILKFSEVKIYNLPQHINHYLGLFLFCVGFIIMTICIVTFAIQGKGTLSPADPTKKLVIQGLYKYSRNPMYVGVMLMLIGEAVYFNSIYLWSYLLLVFLAFNLFIIKIEEPRLRRDFKTDYEDYSKAVRRWI